ncbi:MAG: DUF6249 domain-containing protein [Sphingomonadales bacterium]|jgi:hypothetical protein
MDEDIIVPVVLFLSIGVSIIALLMYRHHNFLAAQETLRKFVDTNQALTPELIQSVGIKPVSPFADLRRGILFVAFALGLVVFGQAVPDDEAPQVFLGLSAFPFFLGIGFFIAHYLGKGER